MITNCTFLSFPKRENFNKRQQRETNMFGKTQIWVIQQHEIAALKRSVISVVHCSREHLHISPSTADSSWSLLDWLTLPVRCLRGPKLQCTKLGAAHSQKFTAYDKIPRYLFFHPLKVLPFPLFVCQLTLPMQVRKKLITNYSFQGSRLTFFLGAHKFNTAVQKSSLFYRCP